MLMYEYIISLNQINAQTENCDMDTTANGHDDNNSNDGTSLLEFQLARRNHTNSYVKIHSANKAQRGRSAFPLRSKKEERKENADFNAEKTEREQKNLRSGASNNENGFARAFGGDGGTCECRGGCPPRPPLCW